MFGFAPSQSFSGGSVALVSLLAAVTIAIGVWASVAKEPDQAKKEGVVVKVLGSGTLALALSPDGKILAGAGAGATTGQMVDLWDVVTSKQRHTLKGPSKVGGEMGTPPSKVAFSPDGKTLATMQGDAVVKLWDVATP